MENHTKAMELGNSIKKIRKKRGLSQKQLAAKMGISTNALCSIETNQTWPSKATIEKVCDALEVEECYLLLFSMTEASFPDDKKILYRVLCKPLQEELLRDLQTLE